MSYGRMRERERQLKEEIDQLLAKAQQQDGEEDERYGEDRRGDELPQELRRREDRLAAIEAAKQRLEAAQRAADDERGRKPGQDSNPKGGRPYKRDYGEPEQKAQSNFTDPESPDHEDQHGGVSADATTPRWRLTGTTRSLWPRRYRQRRAIRGR